MVHRFFYVEAYALVIANNTTLFINNLCKKSYLIIPKIFWSKFLMSLTWTG